MQHFTQIGQVGQGYALDYSLNTWLYFVCTGDGKELFEYNLPQPDYYERTTAQLYAVAWLISGYFSTKKGIAYINDMIARLALTLPIRERVATTPPVAAATPKRLSAFQNALSLPQRVQRAAQDKGHHDRVFWAIKLQAEAFIKASGGWFPYEILEIWAFGVFVVPEDVKDRSTLKAKCRSVWHWYEKRDWKAGRAKGGKMSRQDHIKRVNEQRKIDAKKKVLHAAQGLTVRKKNGKLNVSAIAEQAGVSYNTAKKYLDESGLI